MDDTVVIDVASVRSKETCYDYACSDDGCYDSACSDDVHSDAYVSSNDAHSNDA